MKIFKQRAIWHVENLPSKETPPKKEKTNEHLPTLENHNENVRVDVETVEHDYDEVLTAIGFGKVQLLVFFGCGLCILMNMNELRGFGFVAIGAECDLEIDSKQKGLLDAASGMGFVLTAYASGYLSDTVGRRSLVLYSLMSSNFFQFVSMFSTNYWMLLALRIVIGACLVGCSFSIFSYIVELCPRKHRQLMVHYVSIFSAIASIYVSVVAWPIFSGNSHIQIFNQFNLRPWRLMILFNMLPGILAYFFLYFLPESPKILLTLQRPEEAYKAIDWVCRFNRKGESLVDLGISRLKKIDLIRKPKNTGALLKLNSIEKIVYLWQNRSPLFKMPYLRTFILCAIIVTGLYMAGLGVGIWYPEIQNRVAIRMSNETLETMCEIIKKPTFNATENIKEVCIDTIKFKTFIDTLVLGVGSTLAYLLLGPITHKFGTKVLIITLLIMSGIFGVSLLFFTEPIMVVAGLTIFLIFTGTGTVIFGGAIVTLVPSEISSQFVCICLMLGRLGAAIASNILGFFLESHCEITISCFVVTVLVCAALTFFLNFKNDGSKK